MHASNPYIPIKRLNPTRADRDMDRGRAAGARVKAAGGSAMDAAKAWIGATFDGTGTHSRFKDQAQRFIERGAADHEVRARFGAYARAFPEGSDLDWCIGVLDRSWHENRATIARNRFPRDGGYRSLAALADARLILRWLRRTHRAHLWPMILETLAELPARPARTVYITTTPALGGPHRLIAAE